MEFGPKVKLDQPSEIGIPEPESLRVPSIEADFSLFPLPVTNMLVCTVVLALTSKVKTLPF